MLAAADWPCLSGLHPLSTCCSVWCGFCRERQRRASSGRRFRLSAKSLRRAGFWKQSLQREPNSNLMYALVLWSLNSHFRVCRRFHHFHHFLTICLISRFIFVCVHAQRCAFGGQMTTWESRISPSTHHVRIPESSFTARFGSRCLCLLLSSPVIILETGPRTLYS